jgi:(4S)-4-hydroxy-5-phosphonooxypentane-2,3-dione isomerase
MVGTAAVVRGVLPGAGVVQDLAMLIVHVHVRVRPGRAADFLAATLVNARASLGEPGVLRFDVIQDNDDPGHVVLAEVYRDPEAVAAHKQEPHYAAWRDTVAEMMAEPRASAKFSAVFPAGRENWAVDAGRG